MLSVNLGGVIAVASVQDNYVKTTQEACNIDMNEATQTPESKEASTVKVDVNTEIEKVDKASSSRSSDYTKLQTLSKGKSYKITNTSSSSVYLTSFDYDDKSIVDGKTKLKVVNSENITVSYPYSYGDKVSIKEIGGDILRCYSIPAGKTYKMTTNTDGVTAFSKEEGAKLEYSAFSDEKTSKQNYKDITANSIIISSDKYKKS